MRLLVERHFAEVIVVVYSDKRRVLWHLKHDHSVHRITRLSQHGSGQTVNARIVCREIDIVGIIICIVQREKQGSDQSVRCIYALHRGVIEHVPVPLPRGVWFPICAGACKEVTVTLIGRFAAAVCVVTLLGPDGICTHPQTDSTTSAMPMMLKAAIFFMRSLAV